MKRLFDITASVLGLVAFSWLILLAWVVASVDTRANGFFTQRRVGRHGKLFSVVRIRTMRVDVAHDTYVTQANDPRITRVGAFFRSTKIDELPQLWNVLLGDMSFVGPRPDVPGYADKLEGPDRALLLSVRPGITGPATLAYRHEEQLLADQPDPQRYNDEMIFPDKVRINLDYIRNWRFRDDLYIIWKTLFG
jgi:lipopolysaccharide/colanic/teichoic acid biosynthesis glycosyltransferase